MAFEPDRCGSSLASAASYGDAPGIELHDPEPAPSPGDTSAGLIMPAYVKSDQAVLVGFVRQYMSFLKPTTLNRMIKAIQKPQNKLFNRLYPEILNIEDGSYMCLSSDLWAKGKSQGQIEDAVNRQTSPAQLQELFAYFTNPLRLCDKRGSEYIGPPPLERVVNRGHVVLTFEYDPDGNQREFLEQQIRWSIAGTDKRCRLESSTMLCVSSGISATLKSSGRGTSRSTFMSSSTAGISLVTALPARSRFHRVRTPKSRTASFCVPG